MAYITEGSTYPLKIWRIETDTPVEGGTPVYDADEDGNIVPTGGFDNIQAKLLADRTRNLNIRLLTLENQLLNQRLTVLENLGVGDLVEKIYSPANLLSLQDFAFDGVLWLAGQEVSRSTYARLFDKVKHLFGGPLWGDGNGETTFTIPDFRGEFSRGWDGGRGIDSGRTFGSEQADMIKLHSHSLNDTGANRFACYNESDGNSNPWGSGNASKFEKEFSFSTQQTGGVETRPRNRAVLFCVKY